MGTTGPDKGLNSALKDVSKRQVRDVDVRGADFEAMLEWIVIRL